MSAVERQIRWYRILGGIGRMGNVLVGNDRAGECLGLGCPGGDCPRTVRDNYLYMPEMRASGARVLICELVCQHVCLFMQLTTNDLTIYRTHRVKRPGMFIRLFLCIWTTFYIKILYPILHHHICVTIYIFCDDLSDMLNFILSIVR